MRRILSTLSAFLVGTAALLSSGESRADLTDGVTLRLEPGVAVPLTSPQTDRFKVGGELMVKPMVSITPWLNAGPSFSLLWLPSKVAGVDDGTAWGLGATARLMRPRDESNKDTGWKAVSPWVDGDVQYVRTGPLDRAALSVAVGAQVPTSDARTLWVGPFVRYQDVVQSLSTKPGVDHEDARILIAGLTFEFGAAPKRKEEAKPCPEAKPTPPPAKLEEKKPTPPPPVQEPERIEIKQIVPFKVDSAVIDTAGRTPADEVLKLLLANPNYHVQINGHASSEGPPEPYNTNLSRRRAQAVYDYLKARGVPADHMTVKAFGATKPVASNDTAAGRVKNRRVEFEVDFVILPNGASK